MQIILMNIVNQLNVQLFSDTSMYIYSNYANIFFISGLLIVISTEKQEKFMFAKSWWI